MSFAMTPTTEAIWIQSVWPALKDSMLDILAWKIVKRQIPTIRSKKAIEITKLVKVYVGKLSEISEGTVYLGSIIKVISVIITNKDAMNANTA